MATRFYLEPSLTVTETPGFAAWTRTTEGVRRRMTAAKLGTAMSSLTAWAGTSPAANASALFVQFVSRPMAAGNIFTTAGTIKCYVRCMESAVNDNINRQPICVKVYASDGTTLRATLFALAHVGPNTTEWIAGTLTNKTLADGDTLGAAYTTVAGDILVVEVGGQVSSAGGTSVTGTMEFGSNSATDLGENETDATALNPWFEISNNIVWLDYATTVLETNGRVAYWQGGEVSGTLADSAGTNTATATGSPIYGVTGPMIGTTAVSFDGTNHRRFEAPDVAALDLGDVFSFACHVRRHQTTNYDTLLSKGTQGYQFGINGPANTLDLTKNANQVVCVSTPTIINDGAYHHCVITKNGATIHMYIDNVDVAVTITNAAMADTIYKCAIGVRNVDDVTYNQDADVDIAHVALWNVAITAAQVTALYNAWPPPLPRFGRPFGQIGQSQMQQLLAT